MQSNLTYEIHSKDQRDNNNQHSKAKKYINSWNSPKSKLKSNIAKIDEELLSIKEKIKNVENTPKRSQSRFSFQFISDQQQDINQDLKFCALLKELNEKETIIENMLNDMKLIEAKMNSLHYENIELTGNLQSEIGLRSEMEQEIQNMRARMQSMNDLEFENSRLREDNFRMFQIIEDNENRGKCDCNCNCINNKESDHEYDQVIPNKDDNNKERSSSYYNSNEENDKNIHSQPKIVNYDYPQKENEGYYFNNECQDSDMNANTNYRSKVNDQYTIQNVNRVDVKYGRGNKKDNPNTYKYQISEEKPFALYDAPQKERVFFKHCPKCNHLHLEKSRSQELYQINKHKIIFEEEENSMNHPRLNKSNPYIKIDDNQEQMRELKNTGAKNKINHLKDQINQMQRHQLTPITKTPHHITNQNQTASDFSIDDTNTNKDQKLKGRNQNSKSTLGNRENNSLIDEQTEDIEIRQHLETNLETISSDKANKKTPTSNNNQVISLLEKINQLTESLNQSKSEANNKQKQLETIEEENQLLKKQLNDEKSKESLYKITESQPSLLLQEENLQLSFYPTTLFFNQPLQKETTHIISKPSMKKENLFSRLKLNTEISIESSLMRKKVNLGDKILFKPYDKKRLLCFDITNSSLTLIEFIDYSDYDTAFNNSSLTYLNHEEGIYIITGQNNDCLYSYTHKSNTLNKLSNLSNNHSHGGLVLYNKITSNEKSLVCLSGWYNKKVEEFSTKINEWNVLPEMPIEKGESSFLVSNNEKIFSFFGYNCPQKKYLNTIDFCYINSNQEANFHWKAIQYSYQNEPFSLYLKSHSLVAVSSSQFVIIGGYDGKENHPVDSFINMSIDQERNNVVLSQVKRKLFNIDKHHLYCFNCDFSPLTNEKGTQYQVCFDEEVRAHVINTTKMTHDIFYFD